MAFIDARINSDYLYGFTGGPQWNTLKVGMASGYTRKNKDWALPLGKWTTNYALLTPEKQEALLAAFWVCGGGFADFRFKDYNDFRAINQIIGVGDGTSDPIQLVRSYQFGSVYFTRPITLPLNAVIQDSDDVVIAATVNPTTGIATPTSPWPMGKVLRWNGEFDVKAAFEEDYNPFTAQASNVRECPVRIVEVR